MVGTGVLSETDLVSAINWTALGVLLGMFIIASSLREAGFFQWMGLRLARSVDAHPVLMYVLLPLLTAGVASLLAIFTAAVLLFPLKLGVFHRVRLPSISFLLAQGLGGNGGGVRR